MPTVELTAGEALIQHEIRRTAFEHAFGGPIDTGGRAAVALRFDHGLAHFATHVLPLVIERGLTVSQAHNPRNWELGENQGVTPEEMNDWIRAGHVEVWNHSSSHRGLSTPEDIHDEIVASLSEIEEQLPAAAGSVWGFNPPGIPGESQGSLERAMRVSARGRRLQSGRALPALRSSRITRWLPGTSLARPSGFSTGASGTDWPT